MLMSQSLHARMIIVGSGPAGYTAAIYAARAMLEPVLIAGFEAGGQLMITTDVENYPGFAAPIQGPWLMDQMRAQAEHVGTKMLTDHIVSADLRRQPFMLVGDSGAVYTCDTLVIATGAKARWLGIPSEDTFKGYGVSACATCDGFFYRNKPVIVVGGGNSAVEEALYLSHLASKVTLVHRRDHLRAERILQERLFASPKIEVVWDSAVDEILGDETPRIEHIGKLRYIEQVLPSLGETGVTLSTVAGLVPEIKVRESGPADVARLKGDARMAEVVARAVRTRQHALADDVLVPFGALMLRLTAKDTRTIVDGARRRPGTHNGRRQLVEQSVAQVLGDRARQTQQRLGVGTTSSVTAFPGFEDPADSEADEFDLEDFTRKVKRVPQLSEALDRMWPRLMPHELLHDLYGAPPLIAAAARGILSTDEQDLLRRHRSGSFDEVAWTPADAALVDEARHLLGPRVGGADEAVRKYGHIVVDEVQDLSPMQLRMLTRRSLAGSMTVVGDIAQATAPWAPSSWDDIAEHLPNRRPAKTVELTVSYRTPAEVLAVASRVLAVAAPGLTPPKPVRRTGVEPVMFQVTGEHGPATTGDLARAVARAAAEEVDAVRPGRVAVIAPDSLRSVLFDAIEEAGTQVVDARDLRKGGLAEPLVLLAADSANGLEFDSVVVVEPAVIAGETARGLRTLYVALTRPTQRLTVVSLTTPPAALSAVD